MLAPAVVGNVDVGWLRVNLEELCPRAAIVGKILAGAGAVNTVFALIAVSVVGSVQPGWYWWSLTQPVLFALALVVVGLLFRKLLAAVCCVQLEGLFGGARAPRGGTEPRFVAYDVLLLAAMVAFGLGLAVLAEMVQVSPLLGLFVGGLVFSNIPSAKSRWLQGTRNSSHWASRVFFAATIGFLVPITMWTDANVVWTGLLVGGAAFMGRIVAGLLGSAPALLRSPVGIAGVMQVTAGATLQGEIGFFVLFELFSLGRISDRALGPLLWALMANSLIAPLFFQLTVWVFARAGAADDFADAAGFVPPPPPPHCCPYPYPYCTLTPSLPSRFVPAEGVPSGSLPMYEQSYAHSAAGAAGAAGGEFALQADMPGAGKAAQFRESMHKYAAPSVPPPPPPPPPTVAPPRVPTVHSLPPSLAGRCPWRCPRRSRDGTWRRRAAPSTTLPWSSLRPASPRRAYPSPSPAKYAGSSSRCGRTTTEHRAARPGSGARLHLRGVWRGRFLRRCSACVSPRRDRARAALVP